MTQVVRSFAFLAGDLALYVVLGIEAAFSMHLAHEHVAGVMAATLSGMVLGMLVATGTAFMFRPLLGSIETTVPAMIVGMAGGAVVCLFMLTVGTPTANLVVRLGVGGGMLTFGWIAAFGSGCRRRLARPRSSTP